MQSDFRPTGFRALPEVIKNLLIINGIFFLATFVFQNTFNLDLTKYLGMYMPGGVNFRWWQPITHMFMHANLTHIFFNMFALWMFGNVIENIWGAKRFLIYYLTTGFGAAFLHFGISYLELYNIKNELLNMGVDPNMIKAMRMATSEIDANSILNSFGHISKNAVDLLSQLYFKYNIPTIGASGAVFGILLAFGMMFPNTYLYIYFLFPIKAKYFVMIYGAFELLSGLTMNGYSNIAHFAHLGGMIFGYFMIKNWKKKGLI